MNPNLTVYLMVQKVERANLDARAARNWRNAEAVSQRPTRPIVHRLLWSSGAALLRAGTFLQRSTRQIGVIRPVTSEEPC